MQHEGYVFGPFPQGRQAKGDHVQPEIEVLPETAVGAFLFQVLIGGGYNPDIGGNGFFPSHPFNPLFLNNPEYLGLGGKGHIPNFIQKKSSPVGKLKTALPPGHGVGKGPHFMAEEFAFDKRIGNGRAVDRHKGLIRPGGQTMDGPGDQFLARTVFPADEDPGVAGGGLLNQVPNFRDCRADADNIFLREAGVFFQIRVLFP
jgi:hypothetical protein